MRWNQTSCQRTKERTVNDGEGTVVGFRIDGVTVDFLFPHRPFSPPFSLRQPRSKALNDAESHFAALVPTQRLEENQ